MTYFIPDHATIFKLSDTSYLRVNTILTNYDKTACGFDSILSTIHILRGSKLNRLR